MQRISVNLINDCDGNQFNYNNDLLAIYWKQELCTTETFRNRFFDSNRQLRSSLVICWVAQGSRPRCGPRHLILHSNIFFYVELFVIIILLGNSLKCILWYFLELLDPFIKNKNSVLSIWIEENFEQKIYFCLLKMRSIFFKEGKSNFFD